MKIVKCTSERDGIVTEYDEITQELESASLVSESGDIKSVKVYRVITTYSNSTYTNERMKVLVELQNGTVLTSNVSGSYGTDVDYRNNLKEAFNNINENL